MLIILEVKNDIRKHKMFDNTIYSGVFNEDNGHEVSFIQETSQGKEFHSANQSH